MERRFFGTDGIRGPYGGPVINEAFARRLGTAAGRWLVSHGAAGGRVLMGRDTRESGAALMSAIAEGLVSVGSVPVGLGILPTPALSRAMAVGGAALGVMVTASHNPAADNGVKFFGSTGGKLTDGEESEIESLLELPESPLAPAPAAPGSPAAAPLKLAVRPLPASGPEGGIVEEDYVAAAARLLPEGALRGWRVALDTAHGATWKASPEAFRRLGADLFPIGGAPDGRNINEGVGSEHPERLAERVREEGCRLGVAHDGDGDRCILCDEKGGILDGDEILTILAVHALARGGLARGLLVATVQSNLGVDAAVAAAGGRVLRTPVGDRYVAERMRAEGAMLGGESSGHIVCFEVGPTGDGLAAALKVAKVMRETGRPLSELRRILRRFPAASTALKVEEKRPIERLAALSEAIAALERRLASQGRVLVRYSGTEPKLRFLVEGPDEAVVREGLACLTAAAARDFSPRPVVGSSQ